MGNKALVADDDPDLLAAVAASMRELGLEVQCARNGAEFIQDLAEAGPFDIVITDIAMPWMNGLQVALAARHAGLKMPIVLMTALRDEKVLGQVAALGANVVLLRKPFALAELAAVVNSALAPRQGAAAPSVL